MAFLAAAHAPAQQAAAPHEPPGDSTAPAPVAAYETTFPAMGTMVHLTVYAADGDKVRRVFAQAESLVASWAGILTDYDPTSETRRLSELAVDQPVQVSQPLWDVLLAAEDWHVASGGALDCSLGALTQLWRKYRRVGRVPTADLVRAARADTGWQQVHLDRDRQTVQLDSRQVRLDFGAIGKGYIVDKLYELFVHQGLDCCLINISGNMRCGAAPPGRHGWRIAIAPLEADGPPLRKIQLQQAAIATSGDLWQFIEIDGRKHSHILDPRTGYGVLGPLAVTAVAATALDADALATIGCVLDWERFNVLIKQHGQAAALQVSRPDGQLLIRHSSGFPPAVSE